MILMRTRINAIPETRSEPFRDEAIKSLGKKLGCLKIDGFPLIARTESPLRSCSELNPKGEIGRTIANHVTCLLETIYPSALLSTRKHLEINALSLSLSVSLAARSHPETRHSLHFFGAS